MAQDQTKRDEAYDLIEEFRRLTGDKAGEGAAPPGEGTPGVAPPPLPGAKSGSTTDTKVPELPDLPAFGTPPSAVSTSALAASGIPPALPMTLPPSLSAPAGSKSDARQPTSLPPAPSDASHDDDEPASGGQLAPDALTPKKSERRAAKRRAAMPSRDQIAANDDAPSIGGLIYALNQKPSRRPYTIAAAASAGWTVLTLGFAAYFWGNEIISGAGLSAFLGRPELLTLIATLLGPVALMFAVAMIAYRAEEMRLRSSAMTEVAVRLAEPDRMAEQSVASLGQAVRRQVSFMNDAVSRAIGRAGELEALVHNEVASLERSYGDNEQKIRNLISELSGERNALFSTSERVAGTLRSLGTEVPALIETLSSQQIKLAKIIEGASVNLTSLETAIASQTGNLETVVGERTQRLQEVLGEYTEALSGSLDTRMEAIGTTIAARTGDLQLVFEEYTRALDSTLGNRADAFSSQLLEHTDQIDRSFTERTSQLGAQLDQRMALMQDSIAAHADQLGTQLDQRMALMQDSIAAHADKFMDSAQSVEQQLTERTQIIDGQLIERTHALDAAFTERLRLFDDAILRSTVAIDQSVGEKTQALTSALDHHAKSLGETLSRQSLELDESLLQGINAVRRTSENITRQSIKALEGLAGQSELLKNVSENLLSQINTITNRFDNQGQQIIRAANALETANYKIDKTLQNRHAELSQTLDRMAGKADELGVVAQGYTRQLEGSISDAEMRTRSLTAELAQNAEERSRATIADIERMKSAATDTTTRALEDLRSRFTNVSNEVTQSVSSLSSQFADVTGEARRRTSEAARDLATEQDRLRMQTDALPGATRESADAMRRVLQDHLRAIDELSSLSRREATTRDVSRPLAPQQPPRPLVPLSSQSPSPREDHSSALNSLTSALSQEMQTRPRAPTRPGPLQQSPQPQQPAPAAREAWKLGDLLKRAAVDDDAAQHHLGQQQSDQRATAARGGLDFAIAARALDPATAASLWQRLAAGNRGIMVRSIYTAEGRALFDETVARLQQDAGFHDTSTQYLADFERVLQEADRQDPSGETAQGHLRSDYGRVYLFLAHATGRIT